MHARTLVATAALALSGWMASPQAHATDVVNTQVPTGSLVGANTVNSLNWLAEKFSLSALTQVDSIQAYVLSNSPELDLHKQFTLAIYADQVNGASSRPALDLYSATQGQLFQANVSYLADGWNGLSGLNWTLNAGSYWLALEVSDNPNAVTDLLAPTGALPGTAVAFYNGTGLAYSTAGLSSADTFGLRITATPAVPEPNSLALLLAGVGVVGWMARRR